jgi:hypothetical protein
MPASTSYFPQFLEADGVPSVRLASGFLIVLLTIGLEIYFASKDNVLALIEADFVFVGSLFAIGAARQAAQSFATNQVGTTVKTEKADVSVAGDANFQAPNAPGAQPE